MERENREIAQRILRAFPLATIEIKEFEGHCVAQPFLVKSGTSVRWHGNGIEACVRFREDSWPFRESWVENIVVPEDGYSAEFSAVANEERREIRYEYRCRPCDEAGPAAPGGADMIIDP